MNEFTTSPLLTLNRRYSLLLLIALAIAAGVLLLLSACKDDISSSGTSGIVFPDSGVSYGKQVQPLFDRGCAFSGCHGPDTFADRGYSLDSYQNATSRPGIIVPYNPNGSILIQSILGFAANTRRMPVNRDTLNANQTKGLKTWISEGARNN